MAPKPAKSERFLSVTRLSPSQPGYRTDGAKGTAMVLEGAGTKRMAICSACGYPTLGTHICAVCAPMMEDAELVSGNLEPAA